MGKLSYLGHSDREQGVAFFLSGIQSRTRGQALGLVPVMAECHRQIVGFDYNVGPFKPRRIAREIAEHVANMRGIYGFATLVGLSIGAPMSVLVVDAMRKMGLDDVVADPSKFRVVMVDPPFGASTMKAIPASLRPVAPALFAAASLVVPNGVTMDDQVQVPSDEQLLPPSVADRDMMFPGLATDVDVDRYYDEAREADVTNQKDHSLRAWLQQLAWLTGGATKVPFDAMKGVRADLVVAMDRRNTVVDSRLALDAWRTRVDFGRIMNVRAEHCATLRNQPAYAQAFRELMRDKNN